MRTLATVALTGALIGTLGLSGAALEPAVSYAAGGTASTAGAAFNRFSAALHGLVADGSITQAQADEVAATLEAARADHGPDGHRPDGHRPDGHRPDGHAGRPGGGGPGQAVVAKALGLTVHQLQTVARAGETLAHIADAQHVPRADVVALLVAEARTHLAREVAEGALTQAQADERAATLTERVTARLDQPFGHGARGGHGAAPDSPTPTPGTS